jgi:hypothetical protein
LGSVASSCEYCHEQQRGSCTKSVVIGAL